MPKILESDEDADYADADYADPREDTNDGDSVHPRKAAALARGSTNAPQVAQTNSSAPIGSTPVQMPKRRVLDEDDVMPPSGSEALIGTSIPANSSTLGSVPSNSAAQPSVSRSQAAEDDFVLSDDEAMQPPAAKRPKFKFKSSSPKFTPTATPKDSTEGKSKVNKAAKQFYSDDEDDSDFDDEHNVLSASEDEDEFVDMDESDEYTGSTKSSGAKRSLPRRTAPKAAPPVPSLPPASVQEDASQEEAPVRRKRGRPPGSKNKPGAATKKTPTKRKSEDDMYDEDFGDDDEVVYASEDDMVLDDDEDEEDGEEGIERSRDDTGPKKLTARQKAMTTSGVGSTESDLMELTGTRNQPSQQPASSGSGPQRATIGRKPALINKKVERTQPPDDVMQEVSQVVAQLLNRNPSFDKDDFRKRVVPDMFFNPELRKDCSQPSGNFVTLPLAVHDSAFTASLGWSQTPLRPSETKDIPSIVLKRGIRDPA